MMLDHPNHSRVELFESGESLIEHEELFGLRPADCLHAIQGLLGDPAAAFHRENIAGVIHQHLTHDLGGHRIEVAAALPEGVFLFHQAEERLIHQLGGLKGLAFVLPAKLCNRKLTQFGIDERRYVLSGLLVAFAPSRQKIGNLTHCTHHSVDVWLVS